MSRGLILMAGLAGVAGTAGLTALVRPGAARRVLRLPARAETVYALRIGGMMALALGLLLGGFAATLTLSGAAA
ncbi:hypothetical protein TPR58_13195 [Sphingomonas sp. HF-S3]|uniref:Uncharacterized protein n=1 Tax=Sphingomonas rustica TaxID=3103142 RepID=A0ABV0BAD2_9SPHN